MKSQLRFTAGEVPLLGRHIGILEVEVPPTTVPDARYVLIADCSTSMTESLPDVRDHLVEFVESLGEETGCSIIIYSGHNTAKLIGQVTEATKSAKKALVEAIGRHVRPIGTTVFSEPLQLVLEHLKQLKDKAFFCATLLTDGCAVPERWSADQERQLAVTAVRALHKFGAVINVIGYGLHYDLAFIARIMEASGHEGDFIHITEIDEFGEAIQDIQSRFETATPTEIKLAVKPNIGNVVRIYQRMPNLYSTTSDSFATSTIYGNTLRLFIEFSHPVKSITVGGTINGEAVQIKLTPTEMSTEDIKTYCRMAGAWAFLTGDRATAAKLFDMIGDRGMSSRVGTAYSERERRVTSNMLRRAFVGREFIGEGLKPSGPNRNVLTVLNVIMEDRDNVVYMPRGTYKRIGRKTFDANQRVIHSPSGDVLEMGGFFSNKTRFNFGFKAKKDIKVIEEGGTGLKDHRVWRDRIVIRDGSLHLPTLLVRMSETTFHKLQEADVIDTTAAYDRTRSYEINLSDLPLVSHVWANPRTLQLVPLLREIADLKAEQTALNARLKALNFEQPEDDEDGTFRGENAVIDDKAPVEYYRADCVEYRLMKFKPAKYDCATMSRDDAAKRVGEVRHLLCVKRALSRFIIFAIETVGNESIPWTSPTTTQRGQEPKQEQLAHFDGAELKRVTWSEQIACS